MKAKLLRPLSRSLSSKAAPKQYLLARSLTSSNISPEQYLDGQVAWIIGGVGPIGQGIARGLLRAGATVIVNSRYSQRLEVLSSELGHPEKLLTVHSSMLAPAAEQTVREALELTSGRIDHVIGHASVRWWTKGDSDETGTMAMVPRGRLLDLSAEEFGIYSSQLPRLHFEAA